MSNGYGAPLAANNVVPPINVFNSNANNAALRERAGSSQTGRCALQDGVCLPLAALTSYPYDGGPKSLVPFPDKGGLQPNNLPPPSIDPDRPTVPRTATQYFYSVT